MALKLMKKPDYYWPVEIKVPVDGGRYETSRFEALFRRVPQADVEVMLERIKAGEVTDRDLLNQTFVGWRDVRDAEGHELPFDEEARGELLSIPGATVSILKAFFESIAGGARKN